MRDRPSIQRDIEIDRAKFLAIRHGWSTGTGTRRRMPCASSSLKHAAVAARVPPWHRSIRGRCSGTCLHHRQQGKAHRSTAHAATAAARWLKCAYSNSRYSSIKGKRLKRIPYRADADRGHRRRVGDHPGPTRATGGDAQSRGALPGVSDRARAAAGSAGAPLRRGGVAAQPRHPARMEGAARNVGRPAAGISMTGSSSGGWRGPAGSVAPPAPNGKRSSGPSRSGARPPPASRPPRPPPAPARAGPSNTLPPRPAPHGAHVGSAVPAYTQNALVA